MRLLLAGNLMTGRGIDQGLAHPAPPRLLESWVRDAREYVQLAEEANGPIPREAAPDSLPPAHRTFAHLLVDLGAADVVHGHSSHHPLGIEVYRGRLSPGAGRCTL